VGKAEGNASKSRWKKILPSLRKQFKKRGQNSKRHHFGDMPVFAEYFLRKRCGKRRTGESGEKKGNQNGIRC